MGQEADPMQTQGEKNALHPQLFLFGGFIQQWR
jgi:hypothetical protein